MKPDRGSFSQRFASAGGAELIASVLAATSAAGALVHAEPIVIAMMCASLLVVAWFVAPDFAGQRRLDVAPVGRFTISRTLLLVAAAGLASPLAPSEAVLVLIAIVLVLLEVTVARVCRGAIPYAVHVPGLSIRNTARLSVKPLFLINTIGTLVLAMMLIGGLGILWAAVVGVALSSTFTAVLLADGISRIRARRRADRRVSDVLEEFAPVFAVHWDAPKGTAYQLAMWLPFLDRLGERYIVIVRDQSSFPEVIGLTTMPVLLRKTLADMDDVAVSTLRATFYVNNAVKNSHFVRYGWMKHIQLNHGDSDKAPSFNPVFRMFDKNFVAGQAAVDRFAANGVHTAPGFFEIVGRPQVENVKVAGEKMGKPLRVLYAPTWAGHNADTAHSSLPIGVAIVQALIDREREVIYRPHPYTERDALHARESKKIKELLAKDATASGRAHVWGPAAESEMTITDCFNTSDAMIADVSSVVPDYLYSEKPYAITAMHQSVEAFAAEHPIASGGYIIDGEARNLNDVLEDLLGTDPLHAHRHRLKIHYLGDFDEAGYADRFVSSARELLSADRDG